MILPWMAPRMPKAPTCTVPAEMVVVPEKLLVPEMSNVPVPIFVMPKPARLSVMLPVIHSDGRRLDCTALVGPAKMVVLAPRATAPESCTGKSDVFFNAPVLAMPVPLRKRTLVIAPPPP